MSAPFQDLTNPWEQAKQRYLESLNDEEKALFRSASLENIFYSASASQARHLTDSKTRMAMNKLQPLVDAIDRYGSALDVLSNAPAISAILCPLWGGIRVILHIAKQYDQYFGKVIEMLASIGEALPKFRDYERIFCNEMRVIEALSIVYLDILLFCVQIKEVFRNEKGTKKWKFYHRLSLRNLGLLWNPLDRRYGGIIEDIAKHKKAVEAEAGHVQLMKTSEAAELQKVNLDLQAQDKAAARLEKIIDMLSTIDSFAQHQNRRKERFEGTGTWLLGHSMYQKWRMDDKSASLWCHGIPGCGKSVLMSHTIDSLNSEAVTNPFETILYNYCHYSHKDTLEPTNIMGNFIKQAIQSSAPIPDLLDEICRVYRNGQIRPSLDKLQAVLLKSLWRIKTITICIDGIDEMEPAERKMMLSIFEALLLSNQVVFKILITSRYELDVSKLSLGQKQLVISETLVAQDMEVFVNRLVQDKVNSGDLRVRDIGLIRLIIQRLTLKSHKMFLYVGFQVVELCEAFTDAQILDLLDHLPYDLAETYIRILKRVSQSKGGESKAKLAHKVFKRIAAAMRPLSLEELQEFVGIDAGDSFLDFDKIPTDGMRMIQACGNLVVYNKEEDKVQFAHQTVLQFLSEDTNYGNKVGYVRQFQFSLDEAAVEAAEICVTYLNFTDFDTRLQKYKPKRQYEDIQVLQKAIATDKSATLGSEAGIVAKFIGAAKANTSPHITATKIDYAGVIEHGQNADTSVLQTYTTTYRFLSYAIDNWLPHTASIQIIFQHQDIPVAEIRDRGTFIEFTTFAPREHQIAGKMVTFWTAFRHLVIDREPRFQFRKWVPGRLKYTSRLADNIPAHLDLFAWAVTNNHLPLLWTLDVGSELGDLCDYDFSRHEDLHESLLVSKDPNMFQALLTWSSTATVRRSFKRAWETADQESIAMFVQATSLGQRTRDCIYHLLVDYPIAEAERRGMYRVVDQMLLRAFHPDSEVQIDLSSRCVALLLAIGSGRLTLTKEILGMSFFRFDSQEGLSYADLATMRKTLPKQAFLAAVLQYESPVFFREDIFGLPSKHIFRDLAKAMRENFAGALRSDPRNMLELLISSGWMVHIVEQNMLELVARRGYAKTVEFLCSAVNFKRNFEINWTEMDAAIEAGPKSTQAEIRDAIQLYEMHMSMSGALILSR